MLLDSTTYRLYLFQEIIKANTVVEESYINCSFKGCTYFIILGASLKCPKCVYLSCLCVNISQKSLDNTQEEYKKKVKEDKKKLVVIIMQILQNKKILAQTKERAYRKVLCLTVEIAINKEDLNVEIVNYLVAIILTSYLVVIQLTLNQVKQMSKLETQFLYILYSSLFKGVYL